MIVAPQTLSGEPSEGSDLFGCAFSRYSFGLWVGTDCNRRRRNGETCFNVFMIKQGFPGVLVVKNPPATAGHIKGTGLIPGSGRSPGREHGNPVQYFCLENPMARGGWQATVHGVAKS